MGATTGLPTNDELDEEAEDMEEPMDLEDRLDALLEIADREEASS